MTSARRPITATSKVLSPVPASTVVDAVNPDIDGPDPFKASTGLAPVNLEIHAGRR